MANSFKRAYGISASFAKSTPCTPLVRHYRVTVDTAAALDLESGMDGYFVPVGGAAIVGDMGGTSPTAKLTYGATDLMTAADPGTGILFSSTAGGVLPGTAAASAKLILTAGGTSPTGTLDIAITFFPLSVGAPSTGVGV